MEFWYDQQIGGVERDIAAIAERFRKLNVKVHGAMTQAEWQQLIDRINQSSDSFVRLGQEIDKTITEELAGK